MARAGAGMSAQSWSLPLRPAFALLDSPVFRTRLAILGAIAFAVACGFAATGESLHALVFVVVALAGALPLLAITHPRAILAVLLAQVIFLPLLPISGSRGTSLLDVLLPTVLFTSWLLAPRDGTRGADPAPGHGDLVMSAVFYYVVALFSIALLAGRGAVAEALDTLGALFRSIQAASLFYVVRRNVRGWGDVRLVRDALLGGIFLAAVVNLPAVLLLGLPRAGAGLVLNTQSADRAAVSWTIGGVPVVITSPNELAVACILVWALLLALPSRLLPRLLGLGLSFFLLLATQSRSGLAAWATLVLVYGMRKGRRALLLLPLAGAASLYLLPHDLFGRVLRTVVVDRGSYEVYTAFIRLFSWQTALDVFLANPLFGVGYMGFRFVSHDYNALGLRMATVENFFLETAVGMGVLGLAALALVAVACVRLGRSAMRRSEPGSPAYRLGEVTPAFLLAIAVGNMTGDNLIGLQNGAQFAIFLALLSRAAELPDCRVAPLKAR